MRYWIFMMFAMSIMLVGCSEEFYFLDSQYVPDCPSNVWCEFHSWTNETTLLNMSDMSSNETIMMRYSLT